MAEGYEKISCTLAHQGVAVGLYSEHIKLPNGKEVDWDLVKHPGGAGILPVMDDGSILLIQQYRNAVDRIALEIPAGKREGQEEYAVCAARELEEETGYRSDHIVHLTDSIPAIGYSNELLGIFYADRLKRTSQHLDEDEWINVKRFSLEDAVDMVVRGQIIDSKTVTAILLYNQIANKL